MGNGTQEGGAPARDTSRLRAARHVGEVSDGDTASPSHDGGEEVAPSQDGGGKQLARSKSGKGRGVGKANGRGLDSPLGVSLSARSVSGQLKTFSEVHVLRTQRCSGKCSAGRSSSSSSTCFRAHASQRAGEEVCEGAAPRGGQGRGGPYPLGVPYLYPTRAPTMPIPLHIRRACVLPPEHASSQLCTDACARQRPTRVERFRAPLPAPPPSSLRTPHPHQHTHTHTQH
jgi:hypothetical protein